MGHGFIREERDVQFLILFALRFFPVAITEGDLLDVVLIDDAFGYFEYSTAMKKLLENKLTACIGDPGQEKYIITPNGATLLEVMERELPPSVCDRAEKAAVRVLHKIRREAAIKTERIQREDGTYTVALAILDGQSEQLRIELQTRSSRQCDLVQDQFRRRAELIYQQLLLLLSGTEKEPTEEVTL